MHKQDILRLRAIMALVVVLTFVLAVACMPTPNKEVNITSKTTHTKVSDYITKTMSANSEAR